MLYSSEYEIENITFGIFFFSTVVIYKILLYHGPFLREQKIAKDKESFFSHSYDL